MRKIIAFEGIDGSGKTVQYELLMAYLKDHGYNVEQMDFPAYKSPIGTVIGELLSGKRKETAKSLDPMSMALWFAADRRAAFDKNDPDCDILVINRYVLSNAAYQSARCDANSPKSQEEMIDWIMELEYEELGLPVPDIFLVFNLSKKQADLNVKNKGFRSYLGGEGKDLYEDSDEMQSGAEKAYLLCAEKFPNVEVINCMENGVMLPKEKIHGMVIDSLVKNNIIRR